MEVLEEDGEFCKEYSWAVEDLDSVGELLEINVVSMILFKFARCFIQ